VGHIHISSDNNCRNVSRFIFDKTRRTISEPTINGWGSTLITFGRAATIVSPFVVLWLSQGYGIVGVLALMIALLAVQIVVVWSWGVEPRQRSLEQFDSVTPLSVGATS
jgi:hypothetical protein